MLADGESDAGTDLTSFDLIKRVKTPTVSLLANRQIDTTI